MNIPILILAAGQSTRMRGIDKLLQDIDGTPLLRRAALIACAVSDAVFVALPAQPHARWAAVKGLNLTRVAVPDAAEGMNASLCAGIATLAKEECNAVMVLLADLPDLTGNDITKVLQSVESNPENKIWRGATEDGKPGHPVVFHRSLFSEISALTGDSGAQSVVRAHLDQVMLVPLPRQNARLDLDTPEEWDAWRRIHSS